MSNKFKINNRNIGINESTYFIADIAANHDGSLDKALDLINLCAESGANAAKFQNFTASTIVSDYGFNKLGNQISHQSSWKKSVSEVYNDASIPLEWAPILKEECFPHLCFPDLCFPQCPLSFVLNFVYHLVD